MKSYEIVCHKTHLKNWQLVAGAAERLVVVGRENCGSPY